MDLTLSLVLVMSCILSVLATDGNSTAKSDILAVLPEMQAANYFTFVTLINMVQDELPSNITFLMPSDQRLSNISIPADGVVEFLSRHTISATLLFDDLLVFPNETFIPNRKGDLLRLANCGKQNLWLNNVQIVRPNICFSHSITCHGIDGVLENSTDENTCYQPMLTVSPLSSPHQTSDSFALNYRQLVAVATTSIVMFLVRVQN